MLDNAVLDPRELRNTFGCFASGITIVSLFDRDGRPTGVTVSSFSSLSLDPALCLFSLGKDQVSCKLIEEGDQFTVNVLASDQADVAWQFARPSEDKFAGIDWQPGHNGVPVIGGSLCHFECRKWATYDGGDHIIIVGQITHCDRREGAPLLFYRGKIAGVA